MGKIQLLAALVVAAVCFDSLVTGAERDARSAESGEQMTSFGGSGRPGGRPGQRPLTTQQFEDRVEFFERRYRRRLLPSLARSLRFRDDQFQLLEDGFLFALSTAINAPPPGLPGTPPPGVGLPGAGVPPFGQF